MEENAVPSTLDTTPQQPEVKKSKTTPLLLGIITVLLLIIIGGGLVFLKNSSSLDLQPSPSPEKTLTPTPNQNTFKAPTHVVYNDETSNIYVSTLDGKSPQTIALSRGKVLGAPMLMSVSPTGAYITYIQLPQKDVDNFQANPPYEFYGADNYELYIYDVKAKSSSLVVNDLSYGVASNPHISWSDDGKKMYFTKVSLSPTENQNYFSYDLQSKKVAPEINSIPNNLKSGSYRVLGGDDFIVEDTRSDPSQSSFLVGSIDEPSDSILSEEHYFNLYTHTGNLKNTIFKAKNSNDVEKNILFTDNNNVFIAREVFYGQKGQSTCMIDHITFGPLKISGLLKEECPPGSSFTNYSYLTLSPDKRYLTALYKSDTVATMTTERTEKSFIALIDINTGEKKELGEIEEWYTDYYWLASDTILAVGKKGYLVSLSSGKAEEYTPLTGKTILSVF